MNKLIQLSSGIFERKMQDMCFIGDVSINSTFPNKNKMKNHMWSILCLKFN